MGENSGFKEDDIQGFIEMVDNDRDGKISKPELINFVMGMFNAMGWLTSSNRKISISENITW